MANTVFFLLAITGWLTSLYIHLNAAIEHKDVTNGTPYMIILHLGVFIVFGTAILHARKKDGFKTDPQTAKRTAALNIKKLFKSTPVWLKVIAGISFIYAFVNFFLFLESGQKIVDEPTTEELLRNVEDTLNEEKPEDFLMIRMFSGHWMAFYSVAAAILFPTRAEKEQRD